MDKLLQDIGRIRKDWFRTNKRVSTTYVPSVHDKIKFNINYYLSRVALFFDLDTALILDSDDLGTSVVLKASGFKEKNIHIPNYFNRSTEYVVMKKRLKNVSVFPISVEDYVDAYVESESTYKFRNLLKEKYDETRYERRPRLKTPLPSRPEQFDFVYLDYCGEYKTNKDTIKSLFENDVFADEFVFAFTGSLFMVYNDDLDKMLKSIVRQITRMKPGIRVDQIFVYNRKDQEGLATQSIQHRDVEQGQFYKKSQGSIKMFFMSFIYSKRMDKYDAQFDKCKKQFCKLNIENKNCLFHPNEGFKSKPFCNNKITDFYLLVDPVEKSFENAQEILDSFDLPYQIKDADTLLRLNRQSAWDSGMLKTFTPEMEMLDIDKIIKSTEKKVDEFVIHSVVEITYRKKKYSVSIECVIGNAVGIHFLGKDEWVKNIENACFMVTKQKLSNMMGVSEMMSAMQISNFQRGDTVEAKWKNKWYIGVVGNWSRAQKKYRVDFDDNTYDYFEEKDMRPTTLKYEHGDLVEAKWGGRWYRGTIDTWMFQRQKYKVIFEDKRFYYFSVDQIRRIRVKAKWRGKWYDGEILYWDKRQRKYKILFDDNTYEFISKYDVKEIKVNLKF